MHIPVFRLQAQPFKCSLASVYCSLILQFLSFTADDDSKKSVDVLDELETIDDDADKHGIQFVKSKDAKLAAEIGIFSFPALVYYETGVPIMYDGM